MKKASLIAIITGTILILTALVMSGFSERRIRDDLQHISHKGYVDKRANFDSSSIQNIKTDISNLNVVVKTHADSGQVAVDYFETNNDKIVITNENGTLSVSMANKKDLFCFFRCISTPDTIIIYIPTAAVYGYDLTTDNASVTFDNASTLHTRALRVVSDNGNVQLQQLTVNGSVDVQSDNGNIRIADVIASDKLILVSSNGKNELARIKALTINSHTDNGETILDTVITKDLSVHTSNGSITFVRLTADHSTITSDNGSVAGTVVGSKDDYSVKVTSANGDIRVDNTRYDGSYFSGGSNLVKSLTVDVSNASVKIDFVQ